MIEFIKISSLYPTYCEAIEDLCNTIELCNMGNGKINEDIRVTFMVVSKSGKLIIKINLIGDSDTNCIKCNYYKIYHNKIKIAKDNGINKLIKRYDDKLITQKNSFDKYESINQAIITMAVYLFNNINSIFLQINDRDNDFFIVWQK